MTSRTPGLSWWSLLAFTHRWLGVAGCLLFLLWFVSGIVMIYVRMPAVTAEDRLARTIPVGAGAIAVSPAEGARSAGLDAPDTVVITMLGNRPVYRFGGPVPTTVFADSAETLGPVSADQATELARIFASAPGTPLRYLGPVTTPDQWTLQLRGHLPMHRVALDDGAGTEIYVSGKTGEVVMRTTRWARALAYAGPVAHWLYLPVLRRNGPLWSQVVIWSSIAGCLLCVSGLIAGLIRFAPFRPFVVQRQRTMTPYRGWMKWHHYAGLVFGVVTTTWTFSGLLSMGPFPLLSSEGPTRGQRDAVTGSPSSIEAITVDQVHASLEIAGRDVAAREMRLVRFRGGLYWLVAASPPRHVLISAANPQRGVFPQFPKGELEAVAREMAPPNTSVDLQWLDEYRRVLLRPIGDRAASGAPSPLRRSGKHLDLPRPRTRRDRGVLPETGPRQPLALQRPPQPRPGLAPNPKTALGHRRHRAEPGRHRGGIYQRPSGLAASAAPRAAAVEKPARPRVSTGLLHESGVLTGRLRERSHARECRPGAARFRYFLTPNPPCLSARRPADSRFDMPKLPSWHAYSKIGFPSLIVIGYE